VSVHYRSWTAGLARRRCDCHIPRKAKSWENIDHRRNGATPLQYSDYKCFRFSFDSGVASVSIDHPPINLLDEVLSQEFDKLGRELDADESVRVVVVQSALPDFL
jgi:hypothetical protein